MAAHAIGASRGAAQAASGLVQPGSLTENAYKVRLPAGSDDARVKAIQQQAAKDFPESGWSIRTRGNAAPALSSNIERFSQFLTLVGLTALVVGGVGVANAVRAYLDGKRGVIATFKSLGASGGFVFAVYLTQILMIAALGIVAGLALGALMPFAASAALQSVIPVPAEGGFYPAALAMAALFGAVPLAIGLGEGSELRQPLGIAIVGGLVLSQLLTLYTTPVIYIHIDRLRLWLRGPRASRPAPQPGA